MSLEFLFDFRKHLSFQFILTLHRFGLDFFQKWKTSNRGRHITPSDPLHDKYCQDTVACCNCRCVHAKDISRSESRSFPRYKCHADASHTSLLSASFFFFQYGTLVRLHWSSVFANAHRNVYSNFWTSYIRQNHGRTEAGRRGSVSACDNGCHPR